MRPAPRQALRARAQIQALRTWRAPPPYPLQTALPLALLASSDEPVMVGRLKLLRIDGKRFQRELKRGLLDVFRIGHLYALEIWIDREGPWTDYLVED
jgi:hypothetical protein